MNIDKVSCSKKFLNRSVVIAYFRDDDAVVSSKEACAVFIFCTLLFLYCLSNQNQGLKNKISSYLNPGRAWKCFVSDKPQTRTLDFLSLSPWGPQQRRAWTCLAFPSLVHWEYLSEHSYLREGQYWRQPKMENNTRFRILLIILAKPFVYGRSTWALHSSSR